MVKIGMLKEGSFLKIELFPIIDQNFQILGIVIG
jgi:hypothetical protein